MALDSAPSLLQSFEAKIISNFVDKLQFFVFPHNFDIQMQISLAVQEEQQRMDYWREAHGLPNYHLTRSNLATTPPMPLPFIDHQIPAFDNNLATSFGESSFSGVPNSNWTSGSSSSSPFRQAINHGMTEDTVSPRELFSRNTHPVVHSAASYNDDMSVFTFSDSDNSIPSLPQLPMPSTHRRKTGAQRLLASSKSSQSHTHHQGRHPLPAGPGQPAIKGDIGGCGTYATPLITGPGQPIYSVGGQEQQAQPAFVLRSNVQDSTQRPKSSRMFYRQTNTLGVSHDMVSPAAAHSISMFPPGQDMPGFVPIGRVGIANAAQGNVWPIERALFEKLVGAERGHGEHRPRTKLTYKEILTKYSRWDIKESTLRGIKRKITLPKEHRERKPRWSEEHISSLSRHVPFYTDKKGKTSWTKVVAAIKRDTGRPFGAGTASKKWNDLNNPKTKRRSAPDHLSQSGGEEGDVEENESSPSVFEMVEVSEEDLPSHKFSFQEDGEDDDNLGGAGKLACVNSPFQGPRIWH